MISTVEHPLPHGITLHCRTCGAAGRPVLLFLHGFPEGAFIWDELLLHFAQPEHGGYRCVAPYLRGFGPSSSPAEPAAYHARHLVEDLVALITAECRPGPSLAALVAHDWGGAIAWNLVNQRPDRVQRLLIINSPHPGAFLRDLQHSAAQQAASEYMHFLCRPDAERLLAEDDYRRLFGFFHHQDGSPPGWLTPTVRAQYIALWQQGLTGPCNYYRASPLRPPRADDAAAAEIHLPASRLEVRRPTLVLWGMDDHALLPGLLEGLDTWVPDLQVQPLPDASHWVVHEQPQVVTLALARMLAR